VQGLGDALPLLEAGELLGPGGEAGVFDGDGELGGDGKQQPFKM
jgi:hypothetical protein